MGTTTEADSPRDGKRLQNAAAAGGVLGAVGAPIAETLPRRGKSGSGKIENGEPTILLSAQSSTRRKALAADSALMG